MAEADSQVLAMQQDPEDEEIEMDKEVQEHVADELEAGAGCGRVG